MSCLYMGTTSNMLPCKLNVKAAGMVCCTAISTKKSITIILKYKKNRLEKIEAVLFLDLLHKL